MKNFIPKKSILGFQVLSSWQSVGSSYFLLLFFYFLAPNFGKEQIQIFAENLFLILLNMSLLILTLNSIYQKKKRPLILWLILSFPLWILVPVEIRIILYAFNNLLF